MIAFLKEAENIKEELITIRRDLHENPELGFEVLRTSQIVKDFLKKEGIPFCSFAKIGVCGIIKGEKDGENKTIALRADMDALPIQDRKKCLYSSKVQGKMHACGHDGHTTILLGVAKILNKYKKSFHGQVKLIFEPAEETTGGAPIMIKEGVLENPRVDMIVGLHVTEDLDCGKIKVRKGTSNAASNPFIIKIKGSGGHGAHPDDTIDPIIVAANVITAIQTIVSREVSPLASAVITVGSIHGGTAQNIIPEEVILSGIIRTITNEDRIYCTNRIGKLVKGICTAFRAEAEVLIEEGYPCLYNEDDAVDRVRKSAEAILGKENVVEQQNPSMGVESFAYFANERPSAFYFLGTRNVAKNTDKPAHSSLFDIDERALPLGVAIQCDIVYEYLTKK
ncbi:M20 metallopeptidase family protein [Clostridium vincentii]|uniref:Putative hydrolase YxeP n=1 Tax=Clostridium vincentii TaxID=52704 RepID=A0A2T0BHK6_9CLOT|nr:M20 family metallopeptidase [Clostridium vincentii]PRR83364.1 putative hydrolase YxeP [Clostridium vincentii]